jgi:hypothetical protein
MTAAAIGRAKRISAATARKHLQNGYASWGSTIAPPS